MPKKRHKKFNKLTSSLKKSVYKKPSADFVLVSRIARQTPYSAEYLSLLVRTGKVFGKKFGRNWFISKKALVGYLKVRGASPVQQLPSQWRQGQTFFGAPRSDLGNLRAVLAQQEIGPISPTPQPSSGQVGPIRPIAEKKDDLAADVKKHLDELEKLHRDANIRMRANDTNNVANEKRQIEEEKDTSFFRPKFPDVLDMSYRTNKTNENYYQSATKSRWVEVAVVSIVTLVLILGGFNLKFANALYGAVKEFVEDATTLQGHVPGTHASEVLLLDKEGKVSIYGHIETQGQFRSYAQQGIAPIVVDSSTTVANLSAEYLDGLSARDFTLQVVTKNGNVTFDNVKLEGGAEVGSLLKVTGAANFLDYISVAKNLSVGGDLVINGRSTLAGGLESLAGADIAGRVNVKGDVDVTNFIAAQRAQIKEGGLIVGGHTQLNTLGISGGMSVADLGVSGNFSVAGKTIDIGDSGSDKLTIAASSTFKGPFEVTSNEAKFGRGITVLANGISVTGASSITGNLTVTNTSTSTVSAGLSVGVLNTTSSSATSTFANGLELTSGCVRMPGGDCLEFGGSGGSGTITSGTTNRLAYYTAATTLDSANFLTVDAASSLLGVSTTTPGAALSVKGAGLFEGFVGFDYFQSTSSNTSWLMGQMGLGTTTPGSQLGVDGSIISNGFVSANYFTATSSLTSWIMGQFGIGTTTPGSQLSIKGSTLSEGFVSADYFTSTSTNSSWLFGNFGIGTTTPGAKLAVGGDAFVDGLYAMGTTTTSSLIATSTIEVRVPTSIYSAGTLFNTFKEKIGIATATPGSLLSVHGNADIGELTVEGPLKTSYLTSTSTTASYFQGALGLGTTTPGSRLSISGAVITDGFVSADYFTSTSSNTSWLMGQFGLGTTTPGAKLSVKGAGLLEWDLTVSFLKSTSTVASSFGGALGIATTSPWGLLSIEHTTAQDFRTPSFVISDAGTSTPSIYVDGGYGRVGFGTSSPYAQLSIEITGEPSNNLNEGLPAFVVSSRGTSTPAFYIANANGNVGVGTSSPGSAFSIGSGATALFSSTATTTFSGGINVKNTGGLYVGGGGLYVDVGDVTFDQKLVVNGNVGIGDTSPATMFVVGNGDLFQIDSSGRAFLPAGASGAGNLALSTTGDTNTGLYFSAADEIRIQTGGSDRVTIDTGGKVGIGTAPSYLLHVKGGSLSFAGAIDNTTDTSNYGGLYVNTANTAAGTYTLGVASNGSYNLLVLGNGNVGMGTTSPGNMLEVRGTADIKNGLYVEGTTTTSSLVATSTLEVRGTLLMSGGAEIRPLTDSTVAMAMTNAAGTDILIVDSTNSRIGVSMAPTQRLSVSGNILANGGSFLSGAGNASVPAFTPSADSDNGMFFPVANSLALATGGTERMRIISTGNVGIGTTTPRAMLDIQVASSTPGINISTIGNTGEGTVAITVDSNAVCVDASVDGACVLNDIAELYPTNDILEAGDIVMLDEANPAYVKKATDSKLLAGVISTSPAIVMEGSKVKHMGGIYKAKDGKAAVALTGRVPVKVNLEGGNIVVGDKIGLSSVAGVGAKALTTSQVVGIALEPFNSSSTRNTVMVLVDNEKYVPESMLTIDANGNVGIGSTTPNYKLTVAGDIAATAFINISTASSKKDIDYLKPAEEKNILEKIRGTQVATYNYEFENCNSEASEGPPFSEGRSFSGCKNRLGLIAEEAPAEVLSIDGKGVDIYKLSTFVLAGVKAQQMQIDNLQTRVSTLESGNSIGGGPISPISPITSALKEVLIVAKSALASIAGSMGDWVNGVLAATTQLKVSSEDESNKSYETYSVTSSRQEITASGSATLVIGNDPVTGAQFAHIKIKFDESFASVVSETEPIKVIVTPTTRLGGGLYVAEKSRFGFEAREINAQDEGGMFDWLVVARKKGAEEIGPNPSTNSGQVSPIGPLGGPIAPATPTTSTPPAPTELTTPPADSTSSPPAQEIIPPAPEPTVEPAPEVTPSPETPPPAPTVSSGPAETPTP